MANIQDSILLFGDSITQGAYEANGVAARLAHVYSRKLDVVNRGLSGYNSGWAKIIFPTIFPSKEQQAHLPTVRLLVLWFGANDAVHAGEHQHIPLAAFAANLAAIVRAVRAPASAHHSPATHVVLVAPPPVSERAWFARQAGATPPGPRDRDFENTRAYAEAVKRVGEAEGVPVLDAWTGIWEAAGKTEEGLSAYLRDGLHLTEKGYDVVYDGLLQVIKEKFPDIYPDNLQSVFVAWDEVSYDNPESTLHPRKAIPPPK